MSEIKIACIGSGNMGFALMKGIAAQSGDEAYSISIGFADVCPEKANAAAAELKAEVFASNTAAAEKADFIFLAVKPQTLSDALAGIAPVIQKRLAAGKAPLLVSMAAGWTIEKIQAAIAYNAASKIPVARIMPNTPALISKGMIALAVSPEVSEEKAAALEAMLKGAGAVDRIPENYFDAITGLSGSGPAFAFLFIEALADGGVLAGLPRDKALRYAAQTVLGSAAMVLETGKHPGELKDMVASPGGTTIAGIAALEADGFRSAAIQAVQAAWKRAKEL
ncbi:MAG: pyrroline-5-carboxylate reductase [Treponema sp.]|jgi:pyrroline-5-carboxylate reductase|nr:pyrroline-5-carboxylate reductase [Treponema sp.]